MACREACGDEGLWLAQPGAACEDWGVKQQQGCCQMHTAPCPAYSTPDARHAVISRHTLHDLNCPGIPLPPIRLDPISSPLTSQVSQVSVRVGHGMGCAH